MNIIITVESTIRRVAISTENYQLHKSMSTPSYTHTVYSISKEEQLR